MEHGFDKRYWDDHWQGVHGESAARREVPPNPHLVEAVGDLVPGRALDAGCGEGTEAIWLAGAGWRVTAADIAAEPLGRAAHRAATTGLGDDAIQWVQADLSSWEPSETFDLVTTHYAHPAMPQLAFYDRLAGWVAPGGTLVIVGHLHAGHGTHSHGAHGDGHSHGAHGDGHSHGAHGDRHPPAEASVTAESIVGRLAPSTWDVVTAEERTRTLEAPGGRETTLDDVVVRAVRRPAGEPR